MNTLEKKSFYSFLGLYIVSSLLFISLIGYWYYTAQKNAFEKETYYKLQHIADMKAGEIITAHMQGHTLKKSFVPDGIELALIDVNGMVREGKLVEPFMSRKPGYFEARGYNIFVSDAPKDHLNIAFVVAQSKNLNDELIALKKKVLQGMLFAAILMAIIAWVLSKLFMKPVRQRVEQIERFINDVTHELNTPITSLSMATDQAMKQGKCSDKMLNNISISTKQLYDIYRSLTYLNFSNTKEVSEAIDLKKILTKSVSYYTLLAEIKHISFELDLESTVISMPESQATLLFGNLIGNAIKYSSPKSTITIVLKDKTLSIEDQGIGIERSKQKEIFEKFKRGTEYSGGFGVGLSIVKSICDHYNIEIRFSSVEAKGTTFTLLFS